MPRRSSRQPRPPFWSADQRSNHCVYDRSCTPCRLHGAGRAARPMLILPAPAQRNRHASSALHRRCLQPLTMQQRQSEDWSVVTWRYSHRRLNFAKTVQESCDNAEGTTWRSRSTTADRAFRVTVGSAAPSVRIKFGRDRRDDDDCLRPGMIVGQRQVDAGFVAGRRQQLQVRGSTAGETQRRPARR